MEQQFCQSCGMPMENEEMYGLEADGTKNMDYCKYCYDGGKFTSETTMQEMIDICVPHMVENDPEMTEEKARGMMGQFFPTLKRWR